VGGCAPSSCEDAAAAAPSPAGPSASEGGGAGAPFAAIITGAAGPEGAGLGVGPAGTTGVAPLLSVSPLTSLMRRAPWVLVSSVSFPSPGIRPHSFVRNGGAGLNVRCTKMCEKQHRNAKTITDYFIRFCLKSLFTCAQFKKEF
jgi:hypothetical protein